MLHDYMRSHWVADEVKRIDQELTVLQGDLDSLGAEPGQVTRKQLADAMEKAYLDAMKSCIVSASKLSDVPSDKRENWMWECCEVFMGGVKNHPLLNAALENPSDRYARCLLVQHIRSTLSSYLAGAVAGLSDDIVGNVFAVIKMEDCLPVKLSRLQATLDEIATKIEQSGVVAHHFKSVAHDMEDVILMNAKLPMSHMNAMQIQSVFKITKEALMDNVCMDVLIPLASVVRQSAFDNTLTWPPKEDSHHDKMRQDIKLRCKGLLDAKSALHELLNESGHAS